MNKIHLKKIKKIYYLKLKHSHIYMELSRRSRDQNMIKILKQFSRNEYNHAFELYDILYENKRKTSRVFRILLELNSALLGLLISKMGFRNIRKYNVYMENKILGQLEILKNSLGVEIDLISILISEDEEHKRFWLEQ